MFTPKEQENGFFSMYVVASSLKAVGIDLDKGDTYSANMIFIFDDNISEGDFSANYAELSKNYIVNTVESLNENQSHYNGLILKVLLPLAVLLLAIVVVTIFASALLSVKKSQTEFLICDLCGISLRQKLAFLFYTPAVVLGFAAIIASIAWRFSYGLIVDGYYGSLVFYNVIGVAVFMAVYISATIGSVAYTKKSNNKKEVRRA